MDDLFDYAVFPDVPGHRGTDTSVAAAADIADRAPLLRQQALDRITQAGPFGYTSEELAEVMGVPRVSIQPRTSELRALRKIADSGQRRANRSSGKKAIVWTLPEFVREPGA